MNPESRFFTLIRILTVLVLASACLTGTAAGQQKTVRIGYAQWSSAIATSSVVQAVLREKMEYDCELISMSAGDMWQALADGELDAVVCAWLPNVHHYYYDKAGDRVRDLGPNLEGTRIGLVVPAYVSIDAISELDSNADRFGGRIIGIDPGAGIMSITQKAIETYGLKNMRLVEGSGAMMTAVLEKHIQEGKWVVVTGWTPHWKFSRWDLKYLKDPEKVFGGTEAIHTVVRNDLDHDKPRVYAFLNRFCWQSMDLHEVMDRIRKTNQPYMSAVNWIADHPEKVQAWISK
jgi:glycine betaine/proline transport system substrate-binding protein